MNNKGLIRKFSFILCIGLFLGINGLQIADFIIPHKTTSGNVFADAYDLQNKFIAIGEQALQAVVGISVTSIVRRNPLGSNQYQDEFFRFFFGLPDREFRQSGIGSGFIVSEHGYILTNEHVVSNADEITVFLADGRQFNAELTGYDVRSDLAVLKIDAENLSYLELMDSDTVKPGQWAIAIGNPFAIYKTNPQPTMTTGIVSAVHRNLPASDSENRYYGDLIQTDAAINPGNSGGPLLDIEGKVMGINVAILSTTGQNAGIGFALPSNQANRILKRLIDGKEIKYGWLGVAIQDLTPPLLKNFGLRNIDGVLVAQVLKDGPADNAGIKRGDIITKFHGKPVHSVNELIMDVGHAPIDTNIEIELIRNNKTRILPVVIGEREMPENQIIRSTSKELFWRGITVADITTSLQQQYDIAYIEGVVVVKIDPQSPAAATGITEGDVIDEVARQPIEDIEDFQNIIDNTEKDMLIHTINMGYVIIREE